jgi:hypothetical protein
MQCVAAAVRRTDSEGAEAPAAMLTSAQVRQVSSDNATTVGSVTVLTAALVGAAGWFASTKFHVEVATWQIAVVGVGVGIFAGFAKWSRVYITADVAPWRSEMKLRKEWSMRWAAVPKASTNPPVWVVEKPQPVGAPTHMIATFAIPPGQNFQVFAEAASRLGPALGSDMVLVSPMPAVDDAGRPIPGSAQYGGFTVAWATAPLGPAPHLRSDLDGASRRFALRVAMIDAFASLKLDRPELAGVTQFSAPDSAGYLIETEWKLTGTSTIDALASKSHELAEKLGVRWLRVGRHMSGDSPSEFVSIVLGDPPGECVLRPPAAVTRRFLDMLDWEAWFRSAKVVGASNRTPQLLSKMVNSRGILEMEFRCADGLSPKEVKKALPGVQATSGLGYMAVEDLDDASMFRLVAGLRDPLNESYLFADYEDQLMFEPTPTDPQIDWSVGIGADGEPITYKWEGEDLPHLLVAGGSGAGKSGVINSLICQLAHNNSPADLELRMMEPKNELVAFADLAHVTHFIYGQTPGDPWSNAAALLADTLAEMHRRYAMFSQHSMKPQKLSEARYIANLEAPNGGTHPLRLPYILVIIEECSNYFTPPTVKAYRQAHEEVIGNAEELARLARAAGIFMVVATQYATNRTIPQVVKQQCRRLGLGVNNQLGSMVIIDEPGLEDITVPGRGLISWAKGYRGFRGYYMRRPSDNDPTAPDDRAAILEGLPKSANRRMFAAAGKFAPASPPPPPPGVWDE